MPVGINPPSLHTSKACRSSTGFNISQMSGTAALRRMTLQPWEHNPTASRTVALHSECGPVALRIMTYQQHTYLQSDVGTSQPPQPGGAMGHGDQAAEGGGCWGQIGLWGSCGQELTCLLTSMSPGSLQGLHQHQAQ